MNKLPTFLAKSISFPRPVTVRGLWSVLLSVFCLVGVSRSATVSSNQVAEIARILQEDTNDYLHNISKAVATGGAMSLGWNVQRLVAMLNSGQYYGPQLGSSGGGSGGGTNVVELESSQFAELRDRVSLLDGQQFADILQALQSISGSSSSSSNNVVAKKLDDLIDAFNQFAESSSKRSSASAHNDNYGGFPVSWYEWEQYEGGGTTRDPDFDEYPDAKKVNDDLVREFRSKELNSFDNIDTLSSSVDDWIVDGFRYFGTQFFQPHMNLLQDDLRIYFDNLWNVLHTNSASGFPEELEKYLSEYRVNGVTTDDTTQFIHDLTNNFVRSRFVNVSNILSRLPERQYKTSYSTVRGETLYDYGDIDSSDPYAILVNQNYLMMQKQQQLLNWLASGGLLSDMPLSGDLNQPMTNGAFRTYISLGDFEESGSDYPILQYSRSGVGLAELLTYKNLVEFLDYNDAFNESSAVKAFVQADMDGYSNPMGGYFLEGTNSIGDTVTTDLSLYYEDFFNPYASMLEGLPPSIQNYQTLLMQKMINRLSVLSYGMTNDILNAAVTNSISSITNSSDAVDSYLEDNSENPISTSLSAGIGDSTNLVNNGFSDLEGNVNSLLDNIEQSLVSSSENNLDITFDDGSVISFQLVHPDFIQPSHMFFSWLWRLLCGFLTLRIFVREYDYWVNLGRSNPV